MLTHFENKKERDEKVAELTADIISMLSKFNDSIPVTVLQEARDMLAEYEPPTEYQVVLDRTGEPVET